MTYSFHNPVKLLVGNGSFSKIGEETANRGKRALIVTYPGPIFEKFANEAMSHLKDFGIEATVFAKVMANPMASIVREGADIAVKENCDVIIGLGGGSAMDTAKGIAFLANKEGDIFDYILGNRSGETALPIILLTTTAGTGSEANNVAVFTNDTTQEKKGLITPLTFAKTSIIDPYFMATLPKPLIAGPGLDAMFHAFESYISVNAHPISEMYSLTALQLSIENLPKVYNDPTDIESWEKVILANTLAGIAIGCAGTTVPHALGQPVSGILDAAHADSLIAVYMPFMRFTAPHSPQKFSKLAELLDCDIKGKTLQEAALMSIQAMDNHINILNAHVSLTQLGVTEEHIDRLTEMSTNIMGKVLSHNPIVPTKEQVKELYRQSL